MQIRFKERRKVFCFLVALLAVAVPALAVFTGMDLDATLANLRRELSYDYQQISETQAELKNYYEVQHEKMVDIAKKCNDLSLMLYSQKQDYTFDISYALEKVTQEYDDFNKNRTPYDRIVTKLNIEINRYARLIESLRRLPPELKDVGLVPDSLAYHNDSLDAHLEHNESLLEQKLYEHVDLIMATIATLDTLAGDSLAIGDSLAYNSDTAEAVLPAESLMEEIMPEQEVAIVDSIAVKDTTAKEGSVPPFILSEMGQMERDSCLFYASQLLRIYAQTRLLHRSLAAHEGILRLCTGLLQDSPEKRVRGGPDPLDANPEKSHLLLATGQNRNGRAVHLEFFPKTVNL